jgi:hypothetical protein
LGRNELIPSVGDPSGDGLTVSEPGLPGVVAEVGDSASRCSEASAVVAIAFAGPAAPANGILPPEKREEVDRRDALEPGRPGKSAVPRGGDAAWVREGDMGGGEGRRGGEAVEEACRGDEVDGEENG